MSAHQPQDPPPGTNPPWDYPWEEWQEAMLATDARAAEATEKWFAHRYPHPEEAAWKLERWKRECSYLEIHRGEFAEFELFSSGRRSLSHHLIGTLWRWFSHAPAELLTIDIPVAEILAQARQSAARHHWTGEQ
jgi:hypothetical protein